MGARHVMGKATLINIDDWPAGFFIGFYLLLEDAPFVFVCFRVPQCFFYMSHPEVSGHNRSHWAQRQNALHVHADTHQDKLEHPRPEEQDLSSAPSSARNFSVQAFLTSVQRWQCLLKNNPLPAHTLAGPVTEPTRYVGENQSNNS